MEYGVWSMEVAYETIQLGGRGSTAVGINFG